MVLSRWGDRHRSDASRPVRARTASRGRSPSVELEKQAYSGTYRRPMRATTSANEPEDDNAKTSVISIRLPSLPGTPRLTGPARTNAATPSRPARQRLRLPAPDSIGDQFHPLQPTPTTLEVQGGTTSNAVERGPLTRSFVRVVKRCRLDNGQTWGFPNECGCFLTKALPIPASCEGHQPARWISHASEIPRLRELAVTLQTRA
jgi:hypothetical protein